MTCATFPRSRSNPFPLIVLSIIAAVIVLASTHAVIRHGSAAMAGQNCFNNGGQVMSQVLQDPLTGRYMKFCNDHGHWYVAINGSDGGNVTVFPRSFAHCLRDVLDYAQRSGFTRLIAIH
jgi:hypothetical protein